MVLSSAAVLEDAEEVAGLLLSRILIWRKASWLFQGLILYGFRPRCLGFAEAGSSRIAVELSGRKGMGRKPAGVICVTSFAADRFRRAMGNSANGRPPRRGWNSRGGRGGQGQGFDNISPVMPIMQIARLSAPMIQMKCACLMVWLGPQSFSGVVGICCVQDRSPQSGDAWQ
jgi:hypothetical protein